MEISEKEIKIYRLTNKREPFSDWLDKVKEQKTRIIIRTRLNRLRLGNFGDCKYITDGVFELRIDFGPGYRIYFGELHDKIIVLLIGGDKSSQYKDIQKAKEYWRAYLKDHETKKLSKLS